MYEGMKKAIGPSIKKSAPLKSTSGQPILDKGKQLDRWVEHYLELYSRETLLTDEALNSMEPLPTLDHLDEIPTIAEVKVAIDDLKSGKAPGKDGIPAEVIRSGGDLLASQLQDLIALCWKEGAVPQDFKDARIVTLYKNKGDRSDCNNYRGISLLCIVGKVFARIVLRRLQVIGKQVYPESKCGFRGSRSTTDMIFSLRQLQEKCREQRQPLYLAFIDLTKAFDLVSRKGLFQALKRIGCPPTLLQIIVSFHCGMKGTVMFDGASSEEFEIKSGVKQGCVLAPTLFGIYFSLLLRHAFRDQVGGVFIHSRSDGGLYNSQRLRAKTKIRQILIRELLFADDAAVAAHSEEELQELLDAFSTACNNFGLTISKKKTQVLVQGGTSIKPVITIDDDQLEVVDSFTYLGSTVNNKLSLDQEINIRIGKASTTMNMLTKRVWNNTKLTTRTKILVYKACILSTLLYGSETWTAYAHQEKRLNSFHMRCLRRITGISWQDKITNTEVLERTGMPSLFTLLSQRRLRWLGHTRRMEDGRIPKDLLYSELKNGKRQQGRPSLRYKDVCKRDMNATGINLGTWENDAEDRSKWKAMIKNDMKIKENTITEKREIQRSKHPAAQDQNCKDSSLFNF